MRRKYAKSDLICSSNICSIKIRRSPTKHDVLRSFNLLDNLNIESAIQIRKNVSIKAKGCPLRRDEVLLIRKVGYQEWKQLKETADQKCYCRICIE